MTRTLFLAVFGAALFMGTSGAFAQDASGNYQVSQSVPAPGNGVQMPDLGKAIDSNQEPPTLDDSGLADDTVMDDGFREETSPDLPSVPMSNRGLDDGGLDAATSSSETTAAPAPHGN